ncbi:14750_t:CDS:2, partial [Funneliformis mosseae]
NKSLIIIKSHTIVVPLFRDASLNLEWIQKYIPSTGTKPVMLVETYGARFTLCGRNDTIETLWNGGSAEQSNGILNRLKNFRSDRPKHDRNLHPIPFLACGPGTGKSRFLQELVNIIRDKALNSGDEDIASLLGNAVFLNVTYGNGTYFTDFDINIGAEASVALRILFSYFVHGNINVSFTKFRDTIGQENAKQLTLARVLRTIYESKHEEDKSINKLAIIVGIDEVNKVFDKDYDKFRDLISAIGGTSCDSEMFFVPVLAGTVEGPLQSIITKSMHPPLQLPLHLLDIDDMLKIACDLGFDQDFVYKDNLFRRMISDIGGQVRALEMFYEKISKASRTRGLKGIDLVDIMFSLESLLKERYAFRICANMITSVLANAILERPVRDDDSPGKDEKDQLITYKILKSNGILTLEPTSRKNNGFFYIRLPYLWVRLLIKNADNRSIHKFWHVLIDPDEPFYWQDWEIFNVKFWALRYCLFSALGHKHIELNELLKGARYSDNLDVDENVDIPDHESINTHYLIHRFPPFNGSNFSLLNKTCNISLKDNSKICKNGGGAEGDG